MKPPIHTSATVPAEFIPPSQDVELIRRLRTAALRKEEQAIERAQSMLNDHGDPESDDLAARRAALADGYQILERDLAAIRKKWPKPQTFLIAVPTSVEREQINSRLISLGLKQITQEQMRATMVMQLFSMDWTEAGEAPISTEANETRAEDAANFLDGFWMRQEAHDLAVARWQEQEIERVTDEAEGAPRRPRAEMPPKIITVRENARMQLIVDKMMSESQPMRDLAAAQMDFARRNAMLLVRMHVVGVVNVDTTIPVAPDPRTRALSAEAADALREAVDDTSWHELVSHIDALYRIDGDEEKNSDSLLEKPSPLNGSIEPSGDPAGSDGSSTSSSSSPAHDGESGKTTGKSSGSASGSATGRGKGKGSSSPTEEG